MASEADLRALLRASEGKSLPERRDTALWRQMFEPGGMRLGEVTSLMLDSVDLENDQVLVHGKSRRVRSIPFGAKTGTALTRYLRVRREHKHANSPALWLGRYGPMPTPGSRRPCAAAALKPASPSPTRINCDTSADRWLAESGGDDTSAMRLFGWRSREMLQRYAASNAGARAAAAAAVSASKTDSDRPPSVAGRTRQAVGHYTVDTTDSQ